MLQCCSKMVNHLVCQGTYIDCDMIYLYCNENCGVVLSGISLYSPVLNFTGYIVHEGILPVVLGGCDLPVNLLNIVDNTEKMVGEP